MLIGVLVVAAIFGVADHGQCREQRATHAQLQRNDVHSATKCSRQGRVVLFSMIQCNFMGGDGAGDGAGAGAAVLRRAGSVQRQSPRCGTVKAVRRTSRRRCLPPRSRSFG